MKDHRGPGLALILLAAAMTAAAQTAEEKRSAGVPERGDHVMGFDHTKTTHHFRLTPSGGRSRPRSTTLRTPEAAT